MFIFATSLLPPPYWKTRGPWGRGWSACIQSGGKCPGSPLVGPLKSHECDNKQTKKKWFCYLNLAVTLISQFCAAKLAKGKNNATTSCKSTWDTVPYFGINSLSMILCLWSPLHPLSKLLAIQDHTQNLEEQLWMGGRREVSIISHRPVTRSDLKQERSFFVGVSQHFCNWL